jgi:hypothetical protein
MRQRLSTLLFEIHLLLRDTDRDRGVQPGVPLERDVEWLASRSWLSSSRRTRQAPFGGTSYSGLQAETDLFVHDGPEFLQIEIKDTNITRLAVTDLWARALDLHLGYSIATYHPEYRNQYVVLVAASDIDDRLRAACLRWGIHLVDPHRLPIAILQSLVPNSGNEMTLSGCAARDLDMASLPFNHRFPSTSNGVLLPYGRFRRNYAVGSLLRFQTLVTSVYYGDRRRRPLRQTAA